MLDWFTIRSVTSWASTQDSGLGLLFIAVGLILIMLGWRFSRSLIAMSMMVAGGVVAGEFLQDVPNARLGLIVAAAAICCAVGVRLPRIGAALLTGGWAVLVVYAALGRVHAGLGLTIVATAMTFFAMAAISIAAYQESVALVTSLEGAFVFLTGACILLASGPAWWGVIRGTLESNPVFLLFLVLTGTVTGYHVQTGDMRAGQLGTFKA